MGKEKEKGNVNGENGMSRSPVARDARQTYVFASMRAGLYIDAMWMVPTRHTDGHMQQYSQAKSTRIRFPGSRIDPLTAFHFFGIMYRMKPAPGSG